jgi:hypothetical protein
MTEKKDPPIDPQDYLSGVNVVDIGDARVLRGKSRRPASACQHKKMHYDKTERRIWCPDCETDVPAFDAFITIVENFSKKQSQLELDRKKLEDAMKFQVRSLAAKALDEVWRGRNMAPCCPHCNSGLLPEDFSKGVGMKVGREYEIRRRGKTK